MRKHWMRYVVVFGTAAFAGGALLQTSQDVQRAESDLRALQGAVESERESIRILKAEWGYLNNPARLENLALKYLDLEPPIPGATLATPASLPDPFIPVIPPQKPVHDSVVMTAQPVSASAAPAVETPAEPPALKPKIKPALKSKPVPPPEKPVPHKQSEKSFGDLLKQYGGAP